MSKEVKLDDEIVKPKNVKRSCKRSDAKLSRPASYPRTSEQQELDDLFAEAELAMAPRIVENSKLEKESSDSDNEISQEQEWTYYGNTDNKHYSDPSRVQYRKNPEKGIRKDLERMNFPASIIDKADELYFEVTGSEIKRSNLRKGIMFACVFQAFKEINDPQTPDQLTLRFNINRKNISKGLTYFHLNYKQKSKLSNHITAKHFIPEMMKKFDIKDEHINAVIELYEKIENKSSELNASNPQSVASGLIYYYFKKINLDISPSAFAEAIVLSEATVCRIVNSIEEFFTEN